MAIDTTTSALPQALRIGESSAQAGSQGRDRWLAALEQESFQVTDNRLRAPSGDRTETVDDSAPAAKAQLSLPGLQPSPLLPAPTPGTGAELLQQALMQAGAPPLALGPGPAMPTAGAAAMQGSPPIPRVTAGAQGPGLNTPTRLGSPMEAIINRARFLDVNLQLTHSGNKTTLWIRDFRQKYSQEILRLVEDLRAALMQQGRSLSRIMVNGKPVHHVTDLLRN
jgi:hypothetical protein